MKMLFLLSVLLLQGCGNPHLTKDAKKAVASLVPTEATAELLPLSLGLSDGSRQLKVSTNGTTSSMLVNSLNPNADDDMVVEYSFEVGTHFRFRGGSFPGTNGDCQREHAATKACALDVEFEAREVGVYADNLIASYFYKKNPSDVKRVLLPLRGEKKAAEPLDESALSATAKGGGSSLDYGRDVVGPARQNTAVIKNNGDRDLHVSVRLDKGAPFRILQGCPEILRAGESCEVDVTYTPTVAGIHQDDIIVSYWTTSEQALLQRRIPVIGEAYTVVVGEPPKPGELKLAAMHGRQVDFGELTVGGEVRKQVEIINSGDLPVNLSDKLLDGSVFGFTGGSFPGTQGTCGDVILPGSCVMDLVFRPTAAGAQSAALSLVSDRGVTLAITLTGVGKARAQEVLCETFEETVLNARASANPAGVTFPYVSSRASTTAKLSYLYGTQTNSYIRELNRYIVKNAQVFVVYDIPHLDGEIVEARLAVDVLKVVLDDHKDTEALCISSAPFRRCSGQEFTLESWKKLKNASFWQPMSTPVNGLYENEFARGTSRCGRYNCMALKTEYDVRALFGLGRSELQELKGGASSFIFTDDTRLVSMPKLVIKTSKKVSCR